MNEIRHQSCRLVLRPPATESDVAHFANETGLVKVREYDRPPEERFTREVAWQVTPGFELYYFEDYLAACNFVMVLGRDEVQTSEFANLVRQYFEPFTLGELLRDVDSASDSTSRARAVIRAGVGCTNEYDERFFERIKSAIQDDAPWVRRAGIWATSYSRWEEFFPLLEEVATTDTDPDIRSEAEIILRISRERRGMA